jgi:hypothetical protein
MVDFRMHDPRKNLVCLTLLTLVVCLTVGGESGEWKKIVNAEGLYYEPKLDDRAHTCVVTIDEERKLRLTKASLTIGYVSDSQLRTGDYVLVFFERDTQDIYVTDCDSIRFARASKIVRK